MDEKLKELEGKSRDNNIPVVLDETAMYLANTCAQRKPKNILEIGTAVGYSGIIMLLNSGDQALLTTIEKDEERFLESRENFKSFNIEPRVKGYLADAAVVLPWLDETYDLIFLDGPKAQYKKYLPYLLKLLDVNGLLIADNIYFKGMVNGTVETPKSKLSLVRSLREFNETISNNKNLKVKFLSIGDGICEAEKIS